MLGGPFRNLPPLAQWPAESNVWRNELSFPPPRVEYMSRHCALATVKVSQVECEHKRRGSAAQNYRPWNIGKSAQGTCLFAADAADLIIPMKAPLCCVIAPEHVHVRSKPLPGVTNLIASAFSRRYLQRHEMKDDHCDCCGPANGLGTRSLPTWQ